MDISIGILAGGKSTRMGRNKAFLTYNRKPFIEIIAEEFCGFDDLMISAADDGIYEKFGKRVVYDIYRQTGPIGGIHSILKAAKHEHVFICAADMPFIQHELAEYLTEFISDDTDCICIFSEERVQPLCSLYSKTALPVIEKMIAEGKYSLHELLSQLRTKYAAMEYTRFDKRTVININTPEEYITELFPIVFCISGIKNSGKTTLVVRLTQEFTRLGYSVGVIKHDGHEYEMDHRNSDTYRFTDAGAVYSSIFSGTKYSINAKIKISPPELIGLFKGVDIIMIEGLKYSEYPKIEIVRSEVSENTVCAEDNVICVASDICPKTSRPIVSLNDTETIIRYIENYFDITF